MFEVLAWCCNLVIPKVAEADWQRITPVCYFNIISILLKLCIPSVHLYVVFLSLGCVKLKS